MDQDHWRLAQEPVPGCARTEQDAHLVGPAYNLLRTCRLQAQQPLDIITRFVLALRAISSYV